MPAHQQLSGTLLKTSITATSNPPQHLYSFFQMNKPNPAVPLLSSLHLHHENVVAGGMKQEIRVPFPTRQKGDQSRICHLLAACLAQVGCSSATSLDVRGKDVSFDFVAQVLGHHWGLGSPGGLTWCPQGFVHLRLQSLNKYRKSSEHRDQAPGSPCPLPTPSQEHYQDAESGSLLCSLLLTN